MIEAVAVDFDGVIHNAHSGWQDGVIYGGPIPGALESLRELMMDHPVFIMTARPDLEPVAKWLHDRGFETIHRETKERWHTRGVLLVTNRKLPAIAYIDDKGVRFTDWKGAAVEVDVLASIAPKVDNLLAARRVADSTFRAHVMAEAADLVHEYGDFTYDDAGHKAAEAVWRAAAKLREKSQEYRDLAISDEEPQIGFSVPCEECNATVHVDLEDCMDNRRKAYVCDDCMGPSDYLNNPPF